VTIKEPLQILPKITLADIEAEIKRRKQNKIAELFPDIGPFRRDLYPKHMAFFEATKVYSEIAFIAGNRVGKSEAVTFAATLFLTGNYPHWWNGRVFNGPTNILVAGETSKLVRDSIQLKFLGPPGEAGTGMIPYENIIERKPKQGMPDAIDTVRVKHKSGGISVLQFGSYDQGREAFQATERDVVVFDEEPPLAIYVEGFMRTMTKSGLVMLAFTPVRGVSEVVMQFQNAMRKD
jgi:phage terminase large subunit-like protein